MKRSAKWLALLLASLMTAASLFACAKNSAWGVGDDDEEQSEKKSDKDGDKESFPSPQTPTAFRNALLDADTVILRITKRSSEGYEQSYTAEKDGDKVKMIYDETDGDAQTVYYDLQNSLFYQSEDGVWVTEETNEDIWNAFLTDLIGIDQPFFSTDHYNKADGKYVMKEDVLTADDMPEGTLSTEMTAEDHSATIQINCEQGIYTITATFQKVTVDLPEADENRQPLQTMTPDVTPDTEPTEDAPETTPAIDVVYPPVMPEEIAEMLYLYENISVTFQSYNCNCSISRDGDIWQIVDENGTSYFDAFANYRYLQDENGDWYKQAVKNPVTWEELLTSHGVPEEDSYFFDNDTYGTYDSVEMKYYFTDEALDYYDLESAYLQYSDTIYTFCEKDNSEADPMQYSLFFDTAILSLPDAEERPMTEEEESFDSTPYMNLNPGEIYDALLTSEEVYLFVETNGDQAKLEKSGDIIRAQYYTASTEALELYYIDLSAQTRYQWQSGDQYQQQELSGTTWEDMLNSAGITPAAYFLQDHNYQAFDDTSDLLEIDLNMVLINMQSATLQRNGSYYHFEETDSASNSSTITISFHDTDTALPF